MLVRKQVQEGVLELRLDRPQRLNALTLALAQQLLEAVEQAQSDSAVRVLLLTGEGRAFCAGKDRDDPATQDFVHVLQRLAAALVKGKPVVAAAQGWAVGAGMELLLNCDLVLAARSAGFMLPEVDLGLFGTGGVVALLPRAVGLARAKGALMLGQPISAQQAEAWGLVWALADDGDLHEEALKLARELAGKPPALLREIKRHLHEETIGDFEAVLRREAQAHRALPPGR